MVTRWDMLFGKLAVKEGLVPPEMVEEATADLTHRIEAGETVYLWEVLVANQILGQGQADKVLKLMDEAIRECPKCQKFADLRSKRGDPKSGCSRCGGPLLRLQIPRSEPPADEQAEVTVDIAPEAGEDFGATEVDSEARPDLEGSEFDVVVDGGEGVGELEVVMDDDGEPQRVPGGAETERYDAPPKGGRGGKSPSKAGVPAPKKVPTALKEAKTEPMAAPAQPPSSSRTKSGQGKAPAPAAKGPAGGAAKGPAAGGRGGGKVAAPKSQEVTCPICDKEFVFTPAHAGSRAECPGCHTQFEPR
ncbi:MAG: hypothetical protein HYZ53_01720 [Planctomycetes bacterium]|nr:hypothetical protein [Planctomycetota bacterium]